METTEIWGDFEVHLDEVLGRGGMGTVYKARQLSLDRWVAVKVLETARASDLSLVQGFLDKFRQEARALAKIPDPRIVTALQAGENDGRYWFAMELIEGRTVEDRLKEGAVAEPELRRIGTEVARALDAAWRQGITHRDVKPANVFLCEDGGVKLGDFGLARSAGVTRTALTDGSAIFCTPDYASPEQAEGKACDFRSDMYSLGCVLYEMATEQPPFQGESSMEVLYKQSTEPPLDPRVLNPGISKRLEAVILRCLQKDPADRYETYGDLIRDLQPPPAVLPGPASREIFWPAAAAAGAALFGIVVAAVFMIRPDGPVEPVVEVAAPVFEPEAEPEPVPVPAPSPEPDPKPAPLSTPAPPPEPGLLEWLKSHRLTGEELEELDRFFAEGAWPLQPFPAQVALAERSDHESLDPAELLEQVGTEPELGLLLPGSIRRACAEIVAAMEFGELRPDLELPEWAEGLAPGPLEAMRRERSAMQAGEEEVLDRYAGTWAWRRLVRKIRDAFRAAPRAAVPESGWRFTRVPREKETSSWKDGVLHDPQRSSTITRSLDHRGWRVEFSFSPAKTAKDPAFFVIPGPISTTQHYDLVRFRPGSCAVIRRDGAEVRVISEAEIPEADRHELAFVQRGPHALITCDGRVIRAARLELDRVIRLSVQQGAARIHRVEILPAR